MTRHGLALKPSVGETSLPDLLEIEDLLNQGSRPGQTVGEYESVGGIFGIQWTVLIDQTGFDTKSSIPDLTLSLTQNTRIINACR